PADQLPRRPVRRRRPRPAQRRHRVHRPGGRQRFFFQAEDGIRAPLVTGVQTCALPILSGSWNTSGAGSTLTPGTSTVTMTGSAQTVNLLASQSFTTLTITGTINQSSQLTASALNLNSGSVTKGTNPLTVNGNLTLAGGALLSTSGPVVIT